MKLFCRNLQMESLEMQNHRGHGLGLWLTKSIVEAHGGSVGVVSDGIAGKGCMFYIELPMSTLDYCSPNPNAELNDAMLQNKKVDEVLSKTSLLPVETVSSKLGGWQERNQLQNISNNMLAQTFHKNKLQMLDSKQTMGKSIASYNNSVEISRPTISFHVELPLVNTISVDKLRPSVPYNQIHVLVVDDMRSNRKVLCKQLEKVNGNIICTEVPDGADAVQLIGTSMKSRPQFEVEVENGGVYYDIIFMDSQMVTMDGPVAIEKIRTDHQYKGLIYGITGDLTSVQLLRDKGANEVYIKPMQNAILMALISGK